MKRLGWISFNQYGHYGVPDERLSPTQTRTYDPGVDAAFVSFIRHLISKLTFAT